MRRLLATVKNCRICAGEVRDFPVSSAGEHKVRRA